MAKFSDSGNLSGTQQIVGKAHRGVVGKDVLLPTLPALVLPTIRAVPPFGGTQPGVVTGKDISNMPRHITYIASSVEYLPKTSELKKSVNELLTKGFSVNTSVIRDDTGRFSKWVEG